MSELKLVGNIFSYVANGIEQFCVASADGDIKSFHHNVESTVRFTIDELNNILKSTPTSDASYVRPTSKPDLVKVTRHFRRHDYKNDCVASNGGIAAICHLDYKNALITVYPALCSEEDNYDKEIGLALAQVREKNDIGFIVKFDKNLSIRENIYSALYMSMHTCGKEYVIWLNEISKQSIELNLMHLYMGDDTFSGVFDEI